MPDGGDPVDVQPGYAPGELVPTSKKNAIWSKLVDYLFQSTQKGIRFYMLQQGRGRGIFGAGVILKDPKPDDTWGYLVRVRFEHFEDPSAGRFLIPIDELRRIVGRKKRVLASPQRSGLIVPPEIAAEFDRKIERQHLRKEELRSPALRNRAVEAARGRGRVTRDIEARQGARPFRNALMRVYQRRCAITNCAIQELLEAVHIIPYADRGVEDVTNGLLLRADLRTAFDRHLTWIDADTMTVRIARSLRNDPTYRVLHRTRLRETSRASAPDTKALRRHAAEAVGRRSNARRATR